MRLVFFNPEFPEIEYVIEDDDQPLGFGAKSKVYLAIQDGIQIATEKQFVIKIPNNPEDGEEEYSVMEQISINSNNKFVPEHSKIREKTTNQEALLIEYLPDKYLAMNENILNDLLNDNGHNLLVFIHDNLELIHITQDVLQLSVSDRKSKDYYWMPRKRLIVLDWNIFEKLEELTGEDQQKKKIVGYKNLSANIFRILFSQNIPTTDEKWKEVITFPATDENYQKVPLVIRYFIHDLYTKPNRGYLEFIHELEYISKFLSNEANQSDLIKQIADNAASKEGTLCLLDYYERNKSSFVDTNENKVIEETLSVTKDDFNTLINEIREKLKKGYSSSAKNNIGLTQKLRLDLTVEQQLAIYRMKLLAESSDTSLQFRENAIEQISTFENELNNDKINLITLTSENNREAKLIQDEINTQVRYAGFITRFESDSTRNYEDSKELYSPWSEIENSLKEIESEDETFARLIEQSFDKFSQVKSFFEIFDREDALTRQLDGVLNENLSQGNCLWPEQIWSFLQSKDLFRDDRIESLGKFDTFVKNKQFFEALNSDFLEKYRNWAPGKTSEKLLGLLIKQEAKILLEKRSSKSDLIEINKSLEMVNSKSTQEADQIDLLKDLESKIFKIESLEQRINSILEISSVEELDKLRVDINAADAEGLVITENQGSSRIFESIENKMVELRLQILKDVVLGLRNNLSADVNQLYNLVNDYDDLIAKTDKIRVLFSEKNSQQSDQNSEMQSRLQTMLQLLESNQRGDVFDSVAARFKESSSSNLDLIEDLRKNRFADKELFTQLKEKAREKATTPWELHEINEYQKQNNNSQQLLQKWIELSREQSNKLFGEAEKLTGETISFIDEFNDSESLPLLQELNFYCTQVFNKVWSISEGYNDERVERLNISLGLLIEFIKTKLKY